MIDMKQKAEFMWTVNCWCYVLYKGWLFISASWHILWRVVYLQNHPKCTRCSMSELQKLTTQLCEGCVFMTKIKITHTDIKPDNICFIGNVVEEVGGGKVSTHLSTLNAKTKVDFFWKGHFHFGQSIDTSLETSCSSLQLIRLQILSLRAQKVAILAAFHLQEVQKGSFAVYIYTIYTVFQCLWQQQLNFEPRSWLTADPGTITMRLTTSRDTDTSYRNVTWITGRQQVMKNASLH